MAKIPPPILFTSTLVYCLCLFRLLLPTAYLFSIHRFEFQFLCLSYLTFHNLVRNLLTSHQKKKKKDKVSLEFLSWNLRSKQCTSLCSNVMFRMLISQTLVQMTIQILLFKIFHSNVFVTNIFIWMLPPNGLIIDLSYDMNYT